MLPRSPVPRSTFACNAICVHRFPWSSLARAARTQEGYTRPKPFISVLGKPMIMWVLDSLRLGPDDSLVIVYNPGWMSPKYWEPVCAKYPQLQLL